MQNLECELNKSYKPTTNLLYMYMYIIQHTCNFHVQNQKQNINIKMENKSTCIHTFLMDINYYDHKYMHVHVLIVH